MKMKKQKKKVNKFDKYFLLNGKRLFLIAIPIIPLYFIFSFVYTIIEMIKNKKYPKRIFYIKLIISIIAGLLITLILIYIDFFNEMYLIPFLAFSILVFGITSLFQKSKKN